MCLFRFLKESWRHGPFFSPSFLQSSRRVHVTVLALVLLSGYLTGGICSLVADSSVFQLMRMGATAHVPMASSLPVLLLPLFISSVAVYTGLVWLVFPIALVKAFLFSYLCCTGLVLFPSSGFLFVLLFLCTDFLSMPVLCWLWCRYVCGSKAEPKVVNPVMLLVAGIGIFDHQVVSPFLAGLLS